MALNVEAELQMIAGVVISASKSGRGGGLP